jgi:predicted  nucleic acid-binding Zn-ribbon protein
MNKIKDLENDIKALESDLLDLDAQGQAILAWQGDDTQKELKLIALADQAAQTEMHIERLKSEIQNLEFVKSIQGLAENRKYQIWLNGGPLPEYQ